MTTTMRSFRDRIRHTLLFEIILIAICVPLLAFVFNKPMSHMGGMSIAMSLIAMVCNYVYNILFDHALVWMGRPLYPRGLKLCLAHAVFFEVGLLFMSVPMVMWIIDLTLMKALLLDVAFLVVIPVYSPNNVNRFHYFNRIDRLMFSPIVYSKHLFILCIKFSWVKFHLKPVVRQNLVCQHWKRAEVSTAGEYACQDKRVEEGGPIFAF